VRDVPRLREHVVVTGAAGFVGRHVVAELLAAGHPVAGLDRRAWYALPGERAVVTDLLAPAALPVLGRAAAVVHLAGCPGVRDARPDAGRWRWRDNVLATQAVLDATARDVPLLVASSSSVYGGAGSPAEPRACHEDDPRRPRGGYARSKAAMEDLCAAARARGRRVGVLRPFTVAGEGQRPDMAVSRWLDDVRSGRPVRVHGSLERRRDVTDVRDVARVVRRALDVDLDGVCNVGTGTTHRLGDLVDAVAAAVGRPADVRVVAAGDEEVPATRADTRRVRRLLGVVPTTDLHDLVARQAAAGGALAAAG
jgi:nucleoside-diphosphate-sugar epimerase